MVIEISEMDGKIGGFPADCSGLPGWLVRDEDKEWR